MLKYVYLLIRRRPPRSTRTYTRFPYTTLCRSPRARIDSHRGIELPATGAVAARLQQSREASRHQTIAKRGDHAAGDKNEPRHGRKDLLNGRGTAQAVESHPAENISAGRFCRRPKPPVISWRAVPAPEPGRLPG